MSFCFEDSQNTSSKAAKKNKKRHNKKASSKPHEASSETLSPESMLAELKKMLEEAKHNKVLTQ